jgi:hypothetical protein
VAAHAAGGVFGATLCLLGDDVNVVGVQNLGATPDIAAGVAALVAAYSIIEGYFMVMVVLPSLEFVMWPRDVASVLLHSPLDQLLLPEGRWVPSEIAELVVAPLLPMRSRPLACVRFLGLLVTCVLAFCSAFSRSMVFSKSCSALAMLLAVLYFAYAIVLVAVRPHRDPVDRAAAPVFEKGENHPPIQFSLDSKCWPSKSQKYKCKVDSTTHVCCYRLLKSPIQL